MNDKENMKIHETQEKSSFIESDFEHEPINNLQHIEGGGPPRKVYLNELPRLIRYFGYFLLYIIPLLFIILIIFSFFH
ncbi:hypothetical protein D3C87_1213250 [compost metagenome]